MHGDVLGFPILSMLVFVPAGGALLITLLSNRRPEYMKLVAAITSVVTGAMSVWLTAEFDTHDSGFQFVSSTRGSSSGVSRGTSVSTASRCS